MAFLLDTTILSIHLKRPDLTFTRFVTHGGQLFTSQVVVGELYAWAFRAKTPGNHEERLASLDDLRLQVEVLPFDDDCAKKFGEMKATMGTAAGAIDLMIAATSVVLDAAVVSCDSDFFAIQRIFPEIHVINWFEETLP